MDLEYRDTKLSLKTRFAISPGDATKVDFFRLSVHGVLAIRTCVIRHERISGISCFPCTQDTFFSRIILRARAPANMSLSIILFTD